MALTSIGYELWFITLFNFFCSSTTNRVFNLTYNFHPFISRAKRSRWARKCIFSWITQLSCCCEVVIATSSLRRYRATRPRHFLRTGSRVRAQGRVCYSYLSCRWLFSASLQLTSRPPVTHASLFLTTSFTLAHPSPPHHPLNHPTLRRTLVITRLCSPRVVLSLQSSELFLTSLSNHQSIYHLHHHL